MRIADVVTGIYAGTVLVDGTEFRAAIFGDAGRKLLEAYLLDFSGDLYGKEAVFSLLEKVRDHADFADDAALKSAIMADVEKVAAYFKRLS